MTNWKNEDVQRVYEMLANSGGMPRSLFYTLPFARFVHIPAPDGAVDPERVTFHPDEPKSPSFDLFDAEIGNWGGLAGAEIAEEENAVQQLTPDLFLACLKDEFQDEWSFAELLTAAEQATVSEQTFASILAEFSNKQLSNPTEMRKRGVLALITAQLSQKNELPHEILARCSDEDNALLDIWSDVFRSLVSEGRLTSNLSRHFVDLFEKQLRAKRENVGCLLNLVSEVADKWNEEVVVFLLSLFKVITEEDKKKSQPFLHFVNAFDLTKVVQALLHVVTSPNLRPIGASQSYCNLLNILVRQFPSFFQKSADFVKIANELTTMSANGECSDSALVYERLQNVANTYFANN